MIRKPGDHYELHTGDVSGVAIVGHHHRVTQIKAEQDTTLTETQLTQLRDFAEAVLQALPALPIDGERRERATRIAAQIEQVADEPDPDHARLRNLASTLRGIVESAGGSVLAETLLRVWQ